MEQLSSLLETLIRIITWAASTDRKTRDEIFTVVGKTASGLDLALQEALATIAKAQSAEPGDARRTALVLVRSQLMGKYHEHNLCSELQQLQDRFRRLFDPIAASVEIGHLRAVEDQLERLRSGRELTIDAVDALVTQMEGAGLSLSPDAARQADSWPAIESELRERSTQLQRLRDEIRAAKRRIDDIM